MTTTKQTAGNNAILKAVKAEFNKSIYARVFRLINGGADLQAVKAFVGRYYDAESRAAALARLFGGTEQQRTH